MKTVRACFSNHFDLVWRRCWDREYDYHSALVLHADSRRTLQRKFNDGSKGFIRGPRERTIVEVDGSRCATLTA